MDMIVSAQMGGLADGGIGSWADRRGVNRRVDMGIHARMGRLAAGGRWVKAVGQLGAV